MVLVAPNAAAVFKEVDVASAARRTIFAPTAEVDCDDEEEEGGGGGEGHDMESHTAANFVAIASVVASTRAKLERSSSEVVTPGR